MGQTGGDIITPHLDFKCKQAHRCVSQCKPLVSARKDMYEKILAYHAGHQEVGRCCTQRWISGIHHSRRQSLQVGGSTLTLKLNPDIARIPKPSISCPSKPIFVVVTFLLLSMERASCSNSSALICWARTLITVPDLILCPLYTYASPTFMISRIVSLFFLIVVMWRLV